MLAAVFPKRRRVIACRPNQRDSRYDVCTRTMSNSKSQRDEDNVGGSPHHPWNPKALLESRPRPLRDTLRVTRNFYANGKEKSQLQSEISGHKRENPVLGGESWRVPDSGTTFCGQDFHGTPYTRSKSRKMQKAVTFGLWSLLKNICP